MADNTFDAIVVGSGISGGWAAKELCEKGLKVLLLERGGPHEHIKEYKNATKELWEFEHRGKTTEQQKKDYPVIHRGWAAQEQVMDGWANEKDAPYTEVKPFTWWRSYRFGGRSMLWGRQSYRWSPMDFEANAKDGIAVDWPIRYKDMASWYTYVEKFVGVSGEKLGLSHLPDGYFLPPMELNCLETHFKKEVAKKFNGRMVTIGRVAHLTEPQPWHLALGRGQCQYRNRCSRGCPYGAYFSSNSATLPAANKTNNFAIRPNSIVHSIILDEKTNRATGVRVIDSETKEMIEFYAKIIFCCASTLATTQILLNSTSNRFPNGLGNDSGELGHNIMDHHYHVGAKGEYDGFEDQYYKGRRPNGMYIPRYVNLDTQTKNPNFIRGFGYQGFGARADWGRGGNNTEGVGADFKDGLMKPSGWGMSLMGFGEILPYHENSVRLDKDKKDAFGIPQLVFSAEIKENELKMREKIKADAAEMLENAGFKNIFQFDNMGGIGNGVHEMGTARMGKDPKTSVLNGNNQIHDVPNVFVTDGACMTSASNVNPSITYMALTARAVDFAVKALKNNEL